MKGVFPAAAGTFCLLAGGVLTWLVTTSSLFYSCRLLVEIDLYSCWSLLAIPLGAGIASSAIGVIIVLRGISNLPWPAGFRKLRSSKTLFIAGSMLLTAIWILMLQFILRLPSFSLGVIVLVLGGVGTLVLLTIEWTWNYFSPAKEIYSESGGGYEEADS